MDNYISARCRKKGLFLMFLFQTAGNSNLLCRIMTDGRTPDAWLTARFQAPLFPAERSCIFKKSFLHSASVLKHRATICYYSRGCVFV